ncbi:MAG: transcriptional regulator [Flammeovirgaceae bacterium]|nr:transcriptional regulator [Flammeovirgaceae bacterium]MBE61694.1 transcriptional regulator [Flammeovirgaceae bacterium]MBR06852.1 transcriptional regulator [Rickettsiales bacterium]HCX24137.1 transcriptional regulator [Cytophagales bacterium]|tara:strand:+ start:213 stop:515 length:303 start_codon:yes stop_codon:yes gene_type:complete
MDAIEIHKVLSNETRMQILMWLKDPAGNFPPHKSIDHFDFGVCSQNIQIKANLSQSVISQYLSMMEKAGLLISTRHGKWTYFRRDEEAIKRFTESLRNEL